MVTMIYPPGQIPEIQPVHEPMPTPQVPDPYMPPVHIPETPPLQEPITPQVPDPYIPPVTEPSTPGQP